MLFRSGVVPGHAIKLMRGWVVVGLVLDLVRAFANSSRSLVHTLFGRLAYGGAGVLGCVTGGCCLL